MVRSESSPRALLALQLLFGVVIAADVVFYARAAASPWLAAGLALALIGGAWAVLPRRESIAAADWRTLGVCIVLGLLVCGLGGQGISCSSTRIGRCATPPLPTWCGGLGPRQSARRRWIVGGVLFAFGGFDVLGEALRVYLVRASGEPIPFPLHIEHWSGLEYSSLITDVFWATNHGLAARPSPQPTSAGDGARSGRRPWR